MISLIKKMKKNLATFLSITMLFCVTTTDVFALENEKNIENGESSFNFSKKISFDPFVEKYVISDANEYHVIEINRITNILILDGEVFIPTIDNYSSITLFATVDYATALYLTYDIPWRGTLAMTGVIMATIPGIGWKVAAAIVSFLATEGDKLYVTCTQYQSKEQYYSQYHGMYYKKSINKNIKAYKKSISPSNLIYGPVDGGWFDPIRP